MVHDLLAVDGERYSYHYVGNNNQRLSKEVLLNDTDPLWSRMKHMHIADLGQLLHTECQGRSRHTHSLSACRVHANDTSGSCCTPSAKAESHHTHTMRRFPCARERHI